MQRNWKLDALRAIAILLVLLNHTSLIPGQPHPSWLHFIGHRGAIGVDIFFVLSGWLIGGQIFRKMGCDGKFNFLHFWERRWIRTLPAYYAMLLIAYLFPIAGSNAVLPDMLFFTQNYSDPLKWGITWSLCVEEHFYLLLPLILWCLYKRTRLAIVIGIVLSVFSVICRAIMFDDYIGKFHMMTHMRLDGLVMGVGMAALNENRTFVWKWLAQHAKATALFGGLVFLACSYNPLVFDWKTPGDLGSYFAIVPATFGVSLGVALLLPLCASTPVTDSTWWQQIVTWIAEHAYALYLTHITVFFWCLALFCSMIVDYFPSHAYLITMSSLWFLSFVAAFLLRTYVEKPGLHFRDWLESRRGATIKITGLAATIQEADSAPE